MAEYFNAYGYDYEEGRWVNLNKVRFSNTDGKKGQRVDYEQGVSPLHPSRFYMASGGYTPTVKTDDELPLANTPPTVDLNNFSIYIVGEILSYFKKIINIEQADTNICLFFLRKRWCLLSL